MNLYKHKKLYEAFDLYCQQLCEGLPTDEELADITFSAAFEEKMRKLLLRQKYGYFVLFGTVGRRVASVAVALLVSMTIATFSVKALREPVVRFITEVFETFTSILFVDDEPAPVEVEMETVVPAYIPEGYVVENELNMGAMYKVVYYNADADVQIYYTQRWNDYGAMGLNTENIEYRDIKVNESDGVIYVNNNTTTIMFINGDYTYLVAAPLTEEELLRIAASIPLE